MGYGKLARELTDARDVGFNNLKINFHRFDDELDIEQTLRAHHSRRHKLCRNEYSQRKLDRQKKRRRTSDDTAEASPRETRRMSGDQCTASDKDKCLLCEGTDGELHAASTFAIDHTV